MALPPRTILLNSSELTSAGVDSQTGRPPDSRGGGGRFLKGRFHYKHARPERPLCSQELPSISPLMPAQLSFSLSQQSLSLGQLLLYAN